MGLITKLGYASSTKKRIMDILEDKNSFSKNEQQRQKRRDILIQNFTRKEKDNCSGDSGIKK